MQVKTLKKKGQNHKTNHYSSTFYCIKQTNRLLIFTPNKLLHHVAVFPAGLRVFVCVCTWECVPSSQPFAVWAMCSVIDSCSSAWLFGMPPGCVSVFVYVCVLVRVCDMPGLMSSGVINRTVKWPRVLPSALLPPLQTLQLVELIARRSVVELQVVAVSPEEVNKNS